MTLKIVNMTADAARNIISWQYPDDYAMYNMTTDDIEAEVKFFLDSDNHYYAIVDDTEALVGHCVFYAEARVPGGEYNLNALDIGIGMRPNRTGLGKGSEVMRLVMAFGQERYNPTKFRATVAAWNDRAQKVCTNNGFTEVSRFKASASGKEFIILLRDV